jgi:hypothetical protein
MFPSRTSNRPVMVEWADAESTSEWRRDSTLRGEQDKGPMLCRTVGWIVHETKEVLTLACSFSNDHDVAGTWKIPQSCVRKVTFLNFEREEGGDQKAVNTAEGLVSAIHLTPFEGESAGEFQDRVERQDKLMREYVDLAAALKGVELPPSMSPTPTPAKPVADELRTIERMRKHAEEVLANAHERECRLMMRPMEPHEVDMVIVKSREHVRNHLDRNMD